MTQQLPNNEKFLEILEIAKVAEQKAMQMSESVTAMVEKHQGWYEVNNSERKKQVHLEN